MSQFLRTGLQGSAEFPKFSGLLGSPSFHQLLEEHSHSGSLYPAKDPLTSVVSSWLQAYNYVIRKWSKLIECEHPK